MFGLWNWKKQEAAVEDQKQEIQAQLSEIMDDDGNLRQGVSGEQVRLVTAKLKELNVAYSDVFANIQECRREIGELEEQRKQVANRVNSFKYARFYRNKKMLSSLLNL